jgi:hypothetical protein
MLRPSRPHPPSPAPRRLQLQLARLLLSHVSVVARPAVAVNISAAFKVRVRNPDLFALDYRPRERDGWIGSSGREVDSVVLSWKGEWESGVPTSLLGSR